MLLNAYVVRAIGGTRMANTRDDEHSYAYFLDRGDASLSVAVKLTASVAAAGGFQIIPPEQLGSVPDIGSIMHHKGMRHITIHKEGTKYRDTIPVAEPGFAKYIDGGTVDGIAGRDGWKVTGRRGEKFSAF